MTIITTPLPSTETIQNIAVKPGYSNRVIFDINSTIAPASTNEFKIEFVSSEPGLSVIVPDPFIPGTSIVEGIISISETFQPTPINQYNDISVTLTPVLSEKINDIWTVVETDMAVLEFTNPGPLLKPIGFGNSYQGVTSLSPYMSRDAIYNSTYSMFWYGKKPVTFYLSHYTDCVIPVTDWGTFRPYFNFSNEHVNNSVRLNTFTLESWPEQVLESVSGIGQENDVINIGAALTPIELPDLINEVWGDNYSWYYNTTGYFKDYLSWGGTLSLNFSYAKRNLVTTPSTISSPSIVAYGDFAFQFAQKLDKAITVHLNNANLTFYYMTTAFGSDIAQQITTNNLTEFTFIPDGTTDEICVSLSSNSASPITPNITITEADYIIPAATAITSGQTISASSFTGPGDPYYNFKTNMYSFNGTVGQTIDISSTITGATTWTPRILLLNSNKVPVFADPDQNTSVAAIHGKLPATGTYYIASTYLSETDVITAHNITMTLSTQAFSMNTVYNNTVPTANTITVNPTVRTAWYEAQIDGVVKVFVDENEFPVTYPVLTFDTSDYNTSLHTIKVIGIDWSTNTTTTDTFTFNGTA